MGVSHVLPLPFPFHCSPAFLSIAPEYTVHKVLTYIVKYALILFHDSNPGPLKALQKRHDCLIELRLRRVYTKKFRVTGFVREARRPSTVRDLCK